MGRGGRVESNMMGNKRHFLAMMNLYALGEPSFLFNMIDVNTMNNITVMKTIEKPLYFLTFTILFYSF